MGGSRSRATQVVTQILEKRSEVWALLKHSEHRRHTAAARVLEILVGAFFNSTARESVHLGILKSLIDKSHAWEVLILMKVSVPPSSLPSSLSFSPPSPILLQSSLLGDSSKSRTCNSLAWVGDHVGSFR